MTEPSENMLWIAHDPNIFDPQKNCEQFNGAEPAWGESEDDHLSKQGIPVPLVGDTLCLRMGRRQVVERRLEAPERDRAGNRVTGWYWMILVR